MKQRKQHKKNTIAMFLSLAMTMSTIIPTDNIKAAEYDNYSNLELKEDGKEEAIGSEKEIVETAEVLEEIILKEDTDEGEESISQEIKKSEKSIIIDSEINDLPEVESTITEESIFEEDKENSNDPSYSLKTSIDQVDITVLSYEDIFPTGSEVVVKRESFEKFKPVFEHKDDYKSQEVTDAFLYRIYILDELGNIFETEGDLVYRFENLPMTLETESYDLCKITWDESDKSYLIEKIEENINLSEGKAEIKVAEKEVRTSLLGIVAHRSVEQEMIETP